MTWAITGYNTQAAAPVQDGAILNPGTASQASGQGVWVNNTGTVSAAVTLTLASGFTIIGLASPGTTIFPTQATNYTTAAGGITAYTVRTT